MRTLIKKIIISIKSIFVYMLTTGVRDRRKCTKCGRCIVGKKCEH